MIKISIASSNNKTRKVIEKALLQHLGRPLPRNLSYSMEIGDDNIEIKISNKFMGPEGQYTLIFADGVLSLKTDSNLGKIDIDRLGNEWKYETIGKIAGSILKAFLPEATAIMRVAQLAANN